MKNLAFHSLLRWKMTMLAILTATLTHLSLKGWVKVFLKLGSERVKERSPTVSCHFEKQTRNKNAAPWNGWALYVRTFPHEWNKAALYPHTREVSSSAEQNGSFYGCSAAYGNDCDLLDSSSSDHRRMGSHPTEAEDQSHERLEEKPDRLELPGQMWSVRLNGYWCI